MNTTRPCGCKGFRTCLCCESTFDIPLIEPELFKIKDNTPRLVYCPFCDLCYPAKDAEDYKQHPNHVGEPKRLEGFYIQLDFLTDVEHDMLLQGIDSMPWDPSQSGRRKQNFGPKCNFKGRKMKLGDFKGFPSFSKCVQDKFNQVPILKDFQTIEQCSLEYDPKRGASIDPHVDDCWVWGERIVTVNLLSDSVLIMTGNQNPKKYNLDLVSTYPKVVSNMVRTPMEKVNNVKECSTEDVILVPMPSKSLLVMYGKARYDYEHRILREDITSRRVCLAYREFTPIFLENGKCYKEGQIITRQAKQFFKVD